MNTILTGPVITRFCNICGDDACATTFVCAHCGDTVSDVQLTLDAEGLLRPFHPKDCTAPIVCRCGLRHWIVAPAEEQLNTLCCHCADIFDKED